MKRGAWITVAAVAIGSAVMLLAGDIDPSFDPGSGVDDTPFAIAIQADGKILVGGSFATVRGLVRKGIGRVNTDGTGDASFDPGSGANGAVHAIAIQPDDKILVGGVFSSFNGDTAHRNLVRLNADGSIDNTFSTGTGVAGPVYAVGVHTDGKVVIAGDFTTVNGTSRVRIARLNANGSLDGGFNPAGGVTGGQIPQLPRVNSLAIQPADGKVVIGGEFSSVNGTNRYFIARLNADGSLDTGFNPPGVFPGFTVYYVSNVALQPDGKVLVAGKFPTTAGERTIVRLEASDGSLDGTFANPVTSAFTGATALAIQPADHKILVGGLFSSVTISPTTYARRQIMRLNTNGTMDLTFDLLPGDPPFPTLYVRAIGVQPADGKVIIGGELSSVVVAGRARLERLTTGGSLDGTFVSETGPNGEVYSLALQNNGKIAIGGFFQNIATQSRNRVAQLNANGTLDANFNPGTGANGLVSAVATQPDTKVVIGGVFTQVNGIVRGRLARLNADGGLDAGFCSNSNTATRCATPGPGPNGQVHAILRQPDGKMLIGGGFGSYGGDGNTTIPRGAVARVNADGTLDLGFDTSNGAGQPPFTSTNVYGIALDPNTAKVVIAGAFTTFAGQIRNHVARLTTTGALDTTFVPNTGTAGTVLDFLAVAVQPDSKVIVGGAFGPLQAMTPNRIARLNEDGSIDTGFGGGGVGANGNIHSVLLQPDGKIVIGGEFTFVHGVARNRIARLNSDGTLDNTFAPAANHRVLAMLRQPDGKLVIGGNFTSINTSARWRVARLSVSACAFTDDPLVPHVTTIKAVHVLELRACIDGARAAHNLPAYPYTHTITAQATRVTATDIVEMRAALDAVYDAALQPRPTYTNPVVVAGMTIKAIDIAELRTAVRNAP